MDTTLFIITDSSSAPSLAYPPTNLTPTWAGRSLGNSTSSQPSDEDEAFTPPSAPFPPLQMKRPPAPVPAPLHPQQPTVVSNLAVDQVLVLLLAGQDAFFVCEELGLQAKRALACTCSTLRPLLFQLLRQPRLVVQEHDAIWDNARFVANVLVHNVPQQTLCVAGETCVPGMKLAHLRTLPRLKVGTLGPAAALFFGAAIADSDCVLRLSTGATKSIRALRENDRVNFHDKSDISQRSDRYAMHGALMRRHQAGLDEPLVIGCLLYVPD